MSQPSASGQLEGAAVLRDPLVQELLSARLVGVLATFDKAERIHAVPMWFAAEEGTVVLATGSRSRKVRNLLRDSRATLVIHDSRPGFEVCGVSMTGIADVIAGAEAQPLVDRVHRGMWPNPLMRTPTSEVSYAPTTLHSGSVRSRRSPGTSVGARRARRFVSEEEPPPSYRPSRAAESYLGSASSL